MSYCVVPIQKRLAVSTTNVANRPTKSVVHHRPRCLLTAAQQITQYAKMDNATEKVTVTWSGGSLPLKGFPWHK